MIVAQRMRLLRRWFPALWVIVALLSGCSGDGRPPAAASLYSPSLSSGLPVLDVHAADHVIQVHSGERVLVRFGGGGTSPGFATPRSTDESVIARLDATPDGGVWVAHFEAPRVGRADIIADPPPRAACLPNCAVPEYGTAIWHIVVT